MINPANCDSVKFGLRARDVEKRFCKVYGNVISNYLEFNEDLISGAKEMLNSKKERKKFNSDLPSYQLGFLLSFGVQDTCLSARKFYESIINDHKIIKKLSRSNPIKLFCLESESLPTVIGICQVINEIVKEFGSGGEFDFTEIRILVIDDREKWIRLCGYVIDTANSYFTNIELKLDSVDDFARWSFQEFKDRIKEIDFLVLARFFAEDRIFNYYIIQIFLNEMKEDAILFYFDCCNEMFYANLKSLSEIYYFSQVKNCQNLQASFADLGDEQYCLDLPVSWDKDFQPVTFSTWIKNFAAQNDSLPVVVEPIASKELKPIISKKKSNNLVMLILNKHISNAKTTKTSTSGQTNVVIGKKKVKSSPKQSHESDALRGQTNIVIGKMKDNYLTKHFNEFDTPSEQANPVNGKKKVASSKKHSTPSTSSSVQSNAVSGTKKEKTSTKHCNQSDSLSKQTNVVTRKKKVKSLTKLSNQDISTIESKKTGTSKAKKESHTQKSHEVLDNLLSILSKQTIDSGTAKPSQKSQGSNVPCDTGISQKVISKPDNQVKSVKELGFECSVSYTTQIIKPKKKAKAATSKISTSTGKMITANQGDQTLIMKQKGNVNVRLSVLASNVSQKKKGTSSEIKSKSNTNSDSTFSKELKTKSIDKKAPTTTTPEVQLEKSFLFNLPKKSSKNNTAKTKKSIKNSATEKIKLKGKFAYMDLEKKNKDERHKLRAKKASFAKHANFDFDD